MGQLFPIGRRNGISVPGTIVGFTLNSPLSVARSELSATTVGNYGLFAGGQTNPYYSGKSAVVDAYDSDLTHSTPAPLSMARYNLSATTVGDYGLFAGGENTVYRNVTTGYTII